MSRLISKWKSQIKELKIGRKNSEIESYSNRSRLDIELMVMKSMRGARFKSLIL